MTRTQTAKALIVDTGLRPTEEIKSALRDQNVDADDSTEFEPSHADNYDVVVGMLPEIDALPVDHGGSQRAISFAKHVSQLRDGSNRSVFVTAEPWLHRMSQILRGEEDNALANKFARMHSTTFLANFHSTEDYERVFGPTKSTSEGYLPDRVRLDLYLKQALRYGENPHQRGGLYLPLHSTQAGFGAASARQLQGKELSFNNLNDTHAAFELVAEFPPELSAGVAIIKHANPCGVALGVTAREAYLRALESDPVSAFGGVIALNRTLDGPAAEAIADIFTEVVIAPDADEDARAIFGKKKNLRLLVTGGLPDPSAPGLEFRSVAGGVLVQSRDNGCIRESDLKVVTQKKPTDAQIRDMVFAFRVAKHVKSNAIVYARDGATVGVGAGQMSRVDSARVARLKAEDVAHALGASDPKTIGSVCASDAFFPFPDGLLQAVQAGSTAVIQPGGSIRDDEVIAAADEKGLAMVFTDIRHFRH